MNTSTLPAPITRPNGKVWRPRKPLRINTFDNPEGMTGVVVFGTHDEDTAARAAQRELAFWDLALVTGHAAWWRLVPWDAFNLGCDSTWINDPVRGTPCVVFGE